MRKVDRSAIPVPSSLSDAQGVGDRERKRAATHYALLEREELGPKNEPTNQPVRDGEKSSVKRFNFSAYKEPDVKEALDNLFHGKCAYCESKYDAVMPGHVEHYRPKNRVLEDSAHTGYWWLASEWTNLLPSCAHCNGNNYHEVHLIQNEEPYSQRTRGAAYLLGKLDYFPIGATRAYNSSDSLDGESPQILDPTRTDPSDHIDWVFNNHLSLISARQINGAPDPLGYTTYRLLGLNRQKLVEQRTELMLTVLLKLEDIQDDLQMAAETSDKTVRDRLIRRAIRDIDNVQLSASPNQPYSMMVRSLIESRMAGFENLLAQH